MACIVDFARRKTLYRTAHENAVCAQHGRGSFEAGSRIVIPRNDDDLQTVDFSRRVA